MMTMMILVLIILRMMSDVCVIPLQKRQSGPFLIQVVSDDTTGPQITKPLCESQMKGEGKPGHEKRKPDLG